MCRRMQPRPSPATVAATMAPSSFDGSRAKKPCPRRPISRTEESAGIRARRAIKNVAHLISGETRRSFDGGLGGIRDKIICSRVAAPRTTQPHLIPCRDRPFRYDSGALFAVARVLPEIGSIRSQAPWDAGGICGNQFRLLYSSRIGIVRGCLKQVSLFFPSWTWVGRVLRRAKFWYCKLLNFFFSLFFTVLRYWFFVTVIGTWFAQQLICVKLHLRGRCSLTHLFLYLHMPQCALLVQR